MFLIAKITSLVFKLSCWIYFFDNSAKDLQCFTVKPILDLPAKFQNKSVSEQIVR